MMTSLYLLPRLQADPWHAGRRDPPPPLSAALRRGRPLPRQPHQADVEGECVAVEAGGNEQAAGEIVLFCSLFMYHEKLSKKAFFVSEPLNLFVASACEIATIPQNILRNI